jgi:hypothetical protein
LVEESQTMMHLSSPLSSSSSPPFPLLPTTFHSCRQLQQTHMCKRLVKPTLPQVVSSWDNTCCLEIFIVTMSRRSHNMKQTQFGISKCKNNNRGSTHSLQNPK